MSEVVHADIFFFVTTIAVLLVTVGVLAVLYYVVLILREVRAIAALARKAAEDLEGDFADLRSHVRSNAVRAHGIVELVLGLVSRRLGGAGSARRGRKQDKKDDLPANE